MDLYLDYDKNSKRRRWGKKRSRLPWIIAVLLIVLAVAGGIFGIRYKRKKEEEARRLAAQKQTVTVMFPEGYSIDMMAKRLEDQKIFKAEDFLKAVQDETKYDQPWVRKIPKIKGAKYRLEGFLYPDTYNIYKNAKPEDLVSKMLDNFELKYKEIKKSYKGKKSMRELVTIASIIEREASVEKERPMVAGVVENRLAKKMKLQMCPTVLYVTTKGMYNANKVYYRDLKVDSPYNTYENYGLPVGPICNPGSSALRAAMNPKKHDYLFYHTDGSGKDTHIFTKTYEEHRDTRIINK